MQKFFTLAAAFLLCAATAQAGTLTSATWVGSFQGTPFTLTTGGGGLTVSGTSAGSDASVTLTTVVSPLLSTLDTTGVVPVFISQTLGGSQTIAITASSPAVANQGVGGIVNIFIGTSNAGIFLFSVPLSAGVAGNFITTALVPGFNFPVEVTVTFFAWTSKTITVGGGNLFSTSMTGGGGTNVFPLSDFVTTGTNSLDAAGNGSITLVSPTVTRVCVGAGFTPFPCNGVQQSSNTASVTTLKMNFSGGVPPVPEPGTLLLLGAGLLGLVAVGRRQRS